MNYRSSISFHGKRLSWCPRTWHRCRNQPTPQGGFGPGCLNVPRTFAHRCTRKSLLQPQLPVAPPGPSPLTLLPTPASHGGLGWLCWAAPPSPALPQSQQGAFYFLLLTSVRNEVEPVHEGKDKRQHLSCSFSLNGRDSCSRWHELAYPTYMHLLASRQLRGTNQTSLFWFGGAKEPQATISVYLSGSGIIH